MQAQDQCPLRQTLGVFLERYAGLAPTSIEEESLRARLRTVSAQAPAQMQNLSPNALLSQVVDGGNNELAAILIEAFLGKETSFFRDRLVFEFVQKQIENALTMQQEEKTDREIVLWSCACASGQEALSIAMILDELNEQLPDPNDSQTKTKTHIRIYASDISKRMIAQARLARYNNFDVQHGLTVRRLLKHFEQSEEGGLWQAKTQIIEKVHFFVHNLLLSPPRSLPRPLDWIFCRYTLSTLTPVSAAHAVLRLASLLTPSGRLVLSPEDTIWLEQRKLVQKKTETAQIGIFSRDDIVLPDRDSASR